MGKTGFLLGCIYTSFGPVLYLHSSPLLTWHTDGLALSKGFWGFPLQLPLAKRTLAIARGRWRCLSAQGTLLFKNNSMP